MIKFLGVVFGMSAVVIGGLTLLNLTEVIKKLEIYYEQRKNNYDKKFSTAPVYVKVLGFLFLNQDVRYHNKKNTRYLLLIVTPVLMIWGVMEILLGLGIIR